MIGIRRKTSRVGNLIRLALIVMGAGVAMIADAAAQTPVRVILDSRFEGPVAPFLLALDKKYFKAEGLDVTLDAATPPDPLARLVSDTYDIAFADINAFIRYRDQNPNSGLKAVFIVYNKPPYAIVARKSRGVVKPKDLEGKKLGAPAADPAFAHWRIFAQANDVDPGKVAIENVASAVREPMLAAGQIDAIVGSSLTSFIDLKDRGVPLNDIVLMLMADHGVTLYGNAIVVSGRFLSEQPGSVKGFLRAFLKALKETVKEPQQAVDFVVKRNNGLEKDIELERLRMAIRDNILTPEVKARGYGEADMTRLANAIEQIGLVYKFKAKPKATDIFDASFLPPAAERKAP